MHKALQFLPLGETFSLDTALEDLCQTGLLTAEEFKLLDQKCLADFFCSALGKRVCSAGRVLREFKFSILEDATLYDASLTEEQILMQGVVDCALIEPDGIVVIDFKTDRVTEETLPLSISEYSPQILAYSRALSLIFGLPVKERYLFFLEMGREVPVL